MNNLAMLLQDAEKYHEAEPLFREALAARQSVLGCVDIYIDIKIYNMCRYIYVYIHMYVCVCVYLYVFIFIYLYIYIYRHIDICTYVHIDNKTYVYLYIYI